MENTINNLINIYNLLAEISTKGEDTLRMADCLKAFRKEIILLQQNGIMINNTLKKEE